MSNHQTNITVELCELLGSLMPRNVNFALIIQDKDSVDEDGDSAELITMAGSMHPQCILKAAMSACGGEGQMAGFNAKDEVETILSNLNIDPRSTH